MERIVYVSRAAEGFDLEAVWAMAARARVRNAETGVSGALVHLDGWFAQVLEGPPEAVGATFARIVADPRHRDLDLRVRERRHCPGFRGRPLLLGGAAQVDTDLRAAFGYRAGFPVAAFPLDVLVEFVHQACRPQPAPDRTPAEHAHG